MKNPHPFDIHERIEQSRRRFNRMWWGPLLVCGVIFLVGGIVLVASCQALVDLGLKNGINEVWEGSK